MTRTTDAVHSASPARFVNALIREIVIAVPPKLLLLCAIWLAVRHLRTRLHRQLAGHVGGDCYGGSLHVPVRVPSNTHPASSLTLWDAASSHRTLTVMFWAAVIFVPIILAYTAWTYRAMWGKVTVEQIRAHSHESY